MSAAAALGAVAAHLDAGALGRAVDGMLAVLKDASDWGPPLDRTWGSREHAAKALGAAAAHLDAGALGRAVGGMLAAFENEPERWACVFAEETLGAAAEHLDADALGRVVDGLLAVLKDNALGQYARSRAAKALGAAAEHLDADALGGVLDGLLATLKDSNLHDQAAEALGAAAAHLDADALGRVVDGLLNRHKYLTSGSATVALRRLSVMFAKSIPEIGWAARISGWSLGIRRWLKRVTRPVADGRRSVDSREEPV
jgi:hypothetical protein